MLAAFLSLTLTLTPRLWFRFMVCVKAENQNNSAHSSNKKASKREKARDLLARKRVIYSWPLDSTFQMLDHVKPSINITCAGAFMGPHPLLLIYIPQLTLCCNQSCAVACSSQAANNVCGKGGINIQQTGPTCFFLLIYHCTQNLSTFLSCMNENPLIIQHESFGSWALTMENKVETLQLNNIF